MMKLVILSYVLLSLSFVAGCVGRPTSEPVAAKDLPTEAETVAYGWEKYRVEVSFHRNGTNSHWFMAVRDSWDVLDRSLQPNGKSWEEVDSLCSRIEGLRMIDESLAGFRKKRPNAILESIHIEMQVVSDLWCDLLTGVAAVLMNAHGMKNVSLADGPPELLHGVNLVLNESSTITEVKSLLRTRGFHVGCVRVAVPIRFKDSLDGLEWSEIARQPGLGILAPGVVELDLEPR